MEKLKNSRHFQELKTAVEAAEAAGQIIDEYAESEPDQWKKEDGSSVTEADLKAQREIVEKIKGEFPEDGFLGEEQDLKPEEEGRVWIIDPIDGTFNFEKGYDKYCVSIALEVNGAVKLGVVDSPSTSLGQTFIGVKGQGAYLLTGEKSKKLSVSNHGSIKDSLFYATAFDIYEEELEKEKEVLTKLAYMGASHRQLGSAALELCLLASGRIDFLVNPILKKWDYAAGKLIVEEAGGKARVRDSCFPKSYEVVASNGEIQQEVENAVGDTYE